MARGVQRWINKKVWFFPRKVPGAHLWQGSTEKENPCLLLPPSICAYPLLCRASYLFSLRKIFLCCTCEEDSVKPSSKAQPCYSTAPAPGKPAQWSARMGAWTPHPSTSPLGCVQVKHQVTAWHLHVYLEMSKVPLALRTCVCLSCLQKQKSRGFHPELGAMTQPGETLLRQHTWNPEGRDKKSETRRLTPG